MAGRVGQQFETYRLLRLLGEGTYGEVYLGEHLSTGAQVAVKVLKFSLTPEKLKKFLTEARTIRLKHPHILQLLDFGVADETPFLVMDFASGGNLRDRHPKGTQVPLARTLSYVRQIASALQYAHEMRLIHRDVKPENILLGGNEELLLSDFGSALFTPVDRSPSAKGLIGTAAYMSPEQLRGKAYPASDQYSLGVVVYEWLCGVRPFQGSLGAIINQQSFAPPTPLREWVPALPTTVEAVVLKALAKEPGQRFTSVQEFANALEQAGQPTELRKLPAEPVHLPSSVPVDINIPDSVVGVAQAGEAGLPEAASDEQFFTSTEEERAPATIWNILYRRNPLFTGREELLSLVEEYLWTGATQSCALSGLGGIGKTQLAVEYAYRYRERYRYVFWVRAASRETLTAGYIAMADLLRLPGQQEQEQATRVASARRWLAHHDGWLLILDNADDLSLLADFLPGGEQGHLLLTTRAQATGALARSIPVEKLDSDESMLLLLRRAKQLAPNATLDSASLAMLTQAQSIVLELDGLPLAIDQAGAYIEETECSLSAYLQLYRRRRKDLFKRRSAVSREYPHTVASTWSLSFQQVEASNPAAADLLRLCAFLHPDAIPEAIITEGAATLGEVLEPVAADPFRLNEAIQALRRFSLVKRDPEKELLQLHRLVQVVLKEKMDIQAQRQWAERAVRVVGLAFPEVTFAAWPRCELLLPHALVSAALIDEQGFAFPEANRLLLYTGWYLRERGQMTQAEPLLQQVLAICEQVPEAQDRDTALALYQLAELYALQSRFTESEPLLKRALAIDERILGAGHFSTATVLNSLGCLYVSLGQFAQAEPYLKRALVIREGSLGPWHRNTAETLEDLAQLYQRWGKYAVAEPLLKRALAICERTLGSDHPETAYARYSLGWLYFYVGEYSQSEHYRVRTLAVRERILGPDHPDTALSLKDLANIYQLQGRFGEAEPLFSRAMAIAEHVYGPKHTDVAVILIDLGNSYRNQGRYADAEPLFRRTLAILEKIYGSTHPSTATALNNLARCYLEQRQYARAEPLFQRTLMIREEVLGPGHTDTADTRHQLAVLYREQGRYAEAEPLFQNALNVYDQVLGQDSPRVVELLEDYVMLLRKMLRKAEAARLEARVAAIRARRGAKAKSERRAAKTEN